VLASSGKIVMFTDADLSIPISLVPEFLQAIEVEGYDIAVASRWIEGSRWGESLPLHRLAMGRGFRALVRLILNSGVQDTQCGSKAYRAGAAKLLFDRQRIDSFTFDAEVLFLARKMGLRVKEVPFELRPSHSSTVNPLVDPLRMLKDLIRVRIDYWRGLYR
jgi:glycosyltransferase involved in cell wall biosynthesis